eukprot:gnl/Trimastix_PCT/220.p2 GENE.gnl/Trimastix_PCT/220~~gnl/Trimastix_PCT/220.p2  ORF type:complete len:127 (+),score=4.82 gnl/Trimastix_PCT/220:235-615(+)
MWPLGGRALDGMVHVTHMENQGSGAKEVVVNAHIALLAPFVFEQAELAQQREPVLNHDSVSRDEPVAGELARREAAMGRPRLNRRCCDHARVCRIPQDGHPTSLQLASLRKGERRRPELRYNQESW